MVRSLFLTAAMGFSILLSACGNRDTGKNDELMPKVNPDPEKQLPKKDSDKKHTHEPG
jgi:hypothetical protein